MAGNVLGSHIAWATSFRGWTVKMACLKVQGGVPLFGVGAHGYREPEIGR